MTFALLSEVEKLVGECGSGKSTLPHRCGV